MTVRFSLVMCLLVLALSACDDLSNYDKVSGEGIELESLTLKNGDQFTVLPASVLITGFFEAESRSNALYEMRTGDIVAFTGWTVEFPTGLPGYEFEVISAMARNRDRPQDADPEPGDLLYLSENEINNYLKRVDSAEE